MRFRFEGEIPASKSMMNRALLVQSFFPALKIEGQSDCLDVRHMKAATTNFGSRHEMDAGEAGTTFRFLALRASREKGRFFLKGSPRLLQRPQAELADILKQLGVRAELRDDGVLIEGEGWQTPTEALRIDRSRSSQFASAALLSAWNLPFDLEIELIGPPLSEGYWQMSLLMARDLGMNFEIAAAGLRIPAGQKVSRNQIRVEPDYSSMFSVVAAALVGGDLHLHHVGAKSLQPDFAFFDLLRKMAAPIERRGETVSVQPASHLRSLKASLGGAPDLFPVLAALCSFSDGESHLFDAPQLAHKESDRLLKTQELLRLAQVVCEVEPGGLRIQGRGMNFQPAAFDFDPDQDHRMAMAAALFRLREPKVKIRDPEVVQKSFPSYWKVLGMEETP